MYVHIIGKNDEYLSAYTTAQLARMARAAVKGRGILESHWVQFHERTGASQLVCQYKRPDGWSENLHVAI